MNKLNLENTVDRIKFLNEIAKLMSKPEGTIKIWLYRAREILKEKIEGGFENE